MDLINYFFIVITIFDFTQYLAKAENNFDALVYKLQNCLKNEHVYGNRLVSQEDSSYKRLNYQWQLRGGTKEPLAYFLPESASHISSAIKCAEKLRITCIPKSGGHSFEKYSYGTNSTDLIIDLRLMNWIGIDQKNRKATVEAGTLLGPLISKLWKNGKFVIPTGSCPVVGISGLTLGGGFGYLSRLMGLTGDHVEEMEVITADGKILQVNNSKYSDLFWALRGGGGSFGIVSKFVFKLTPAPTKMILLSHPPKSVFIQLLYHNSSSLDIAFTDASGDPTLIQSYIQLFPTPESSTKKISSYYDFAEAEGRLIGNYKHPFQLGKPNEMNPIYQSTKSFFLYNPITEDEFQNIEWSWLNRIPQNVYVKFSQFLDSSIKDDATPFIHRNPLFFVVTEYESSVVDSSDIELGEQWMNDFFEGTKDLLHHNESYQNYVQQDLPDYLERYYGKNLPRLRQIKKKYDPNNFFHQPQSIPI